MFISDVIQIVAIAQMGWHRRMIRRFVHGGTILADSFVTVAYSVPSWAYPGDFLKPTLLLSISPVHWGDEEINEVSDWLQELRKGVIREARCVDFRDKANKAIVLGPKASYMMITHDQKDWDSRSPVLEVMAYLEEDEARFRNCFWISLIMRHLGDLRKIAQAHERLVSLGSR